MEIAGKIIIAGAGDELAVEAAVPSDDYSRDGVVVVDADGELAVHVTVSDKDDSRDGVGG